MANGKSFLPDPKNIVQTIEFNQAAHVAAAANAKAAPPTFRILRTNELDPYEKQKSHDTIAASAVKAAAGGDAFAGTDRKKAKLSISNAKVEKFGDLSALLTSLPSDAKMAAHKPKIATNAASGRVQEEERNVSVDVWLYAASRENDNDYHIIIGRDPDDTDRRYMNAEISGLPPANSSARAKLESVRTSFAAIVQQQTPGLGYDFYDPPVAITVQGSLFFDMTHAKGSKPGPASVKPKTIWEFHPITSIKPR